MDISKVASMGSGMHWSEGCFRTWVGGNVEIVIPGGWWNVSEKNIENKKKSFKCTLLPLLQGANRNYVQVSKYYINSSGFSPNFEDLKNVVLNMNL